MSRGARMRWRLEQLAGLAIAGAFVLLGYAVVISAFLGLMMTLSIVVAGMPL